MTEQPKPADSSPADDLAGLASKLAAGADLPPLSWEILHGLMGSPNGRSDQWREAGHWALNVLQAELGDGWAEAVRAKNPTGGAPHLVMAAGHAVAYADILELALLTGPRSSVHLL